MPIQLIPPERFDEVQAALRAETEAQAPEMANVAAVASLSEVDLLEYRGRVLLVRPVSYLHGVKLQEIEQRLQKLAGTAETTLSEVRSLLEEAIALFGEIVRPGGIRGWFFRNPFRGATEAEIGALHAFFSACRMRSSVRHAPPTRERRSGRRT